MDLVGTRIRNRRFELGLTLEQVAERAEMDFSNLSKMERGLLGAHVGTVHKLATVLDIPVNEIVASLATNKAA
jgi:transcriptional regulator with XRE-family HTH domain